MNLHDPVRVASDAGSGTATITLSFEAWKGTNVGASTHSVTVLPPRTAPKPEPTAPNLIVSLVHPDRTASISAAKFSPDGKQLLATGYPSGVIQIWDWAAKKEVRRIETPAGYRGSADYASVTPDWKTVYVPVQRKSVKPFETDGKKGNRTEFSGEVRAWDLTSGKEKEPLKLAEGHGPLGATLSPNGRFLVCTEQPSYDTFDRTAKGLTAVWDLTTRQKWKLCDGSVSLGFAPDSKTVVLIHDYSGSTATVGIAGTDTGKLLATKNWVIKERFFSVGPVSPDGTVVALFMGGKKAAPVEVWFLDARTLEDRGKLVGSGNPEEYGWTRGVFSMDSKQFLALDGGGNVLVWNLAEQRVERTIPFGANRAGWPMTLSPDGKTLAVMWSPSHDTKDHFDSEPLQPQDIPQPRVTLLNLVGDYSARVLVAPHGNGRGLAFSPDGRTLAIGGVGAVHLFDLTK